MSTITAAKPALPPAEILLMTAARPGLQSLDLSRVVGMGRDAAAAAVHRPDAGARQHLAG